MIEHEELHPQHRRDLFLIVSILGLALFTVAFIAVASSRYRKQVDEITLGESRYLTTEWRLLQELKAQTDELLRNKEIEIAELTERYKKLAQGNAPAWELWQFEARLRQARAEREAILDRQKKETDEQDIAERTISVENMPNRSQSVLTVLYKKRIKALELENREAQRHILALERELSSLGLKQEDVTLIYMKTVSDKSAEIRQLSDALKAFDAALGVAIEEMRRKSGDAQGDIKPGAEEITTLALIRAIATSPSVRARYPELLASLDRYFELYAEKARTEGEQKAYADAAETVESVRRKAESR